MKPNTQFTLTVEDIETIECALNHQMSKLLQQRKRFVESTIYPEDSIESVVRIDTEIKTIYRLLGRIYHQKNWYRPKHNYVGG